MYILEVGYAFDHKGRPANAAQQWAERGVSCSPVGYQTKTVRTDITLYILLWQLRDDIL